MSSSISFSFKKLVRGFVTSTHSPGCNCIFKVPANQDHSTLLKKSAIHLKRPCKLVHIWTGFQVQAMVHFLCILSFCGPEKRDSDVAQSFFRSSEYNAVVRDQFDAKMARSLSEDITIERELKMKQFVPFLLFHPVQGYGKNKQIVDSGESIYQQRDLLQQLKKNMKTSLT
ncbi:hypothetical protein QVD17_09046 [Tagetes erecta]|uniref:Uncharacterized protein n=1 Tax=Tagetes erecta TaxID=13708 RepID=A0AAD8P4P7_TARER|nr:hypothetical protein QVD17_09046 [Tagetes erecta]